MMIIDVPVAPYSPPEKIRTWISQLEHAREDPDADPFDLLRIEDYLTRARGWLAESREERTTESDSVGWPGRRDS